MKKVMLVDGCESIYVVVKQFLGEEFECSYAASPEEALSMISQAEALPDVIVSEMRFAGMGGDKFLEALKSDERYSKIKFMILSGENATKEKARLIDAGAEDYVTKPFSPYELRARVRRISAR